MLKDKPLKGGQRVWGFSVRLRMTKQHKESSRPGTRAGRLGRPQDSEQTCPEAEEDVVAVQVSRRHLPAVSTVRANVEPRFPS